MRSKLVVLVAGLFAAACQAEQPEVTEVTVTPTEAAQEGTLVVAIDSDPGGLNPAITTSGGTHTASELFYNGLVALDEEGEPVAELAERWEVEQDGRLYRFQLRDDVTWHDGKPFTAADVKFTFEQALLQLHARTKASMGPALQGIETPDEHTVVFRFRQPYAPLLSQLNVTEAPILPRHVFEGTDLQTNPATNAPVGTGPFRFVSYDAEEEIRAERNRDYFKDGLPRLDEVVMRIIPDRATQVLSLEGGEVDFLWNLTGPDIERLEQDPDVELGRTASNPGGSNCIMTMSFNLDRPVLKRLEVRRAIAHALDRRQFFEQVEFRQGAVAEAPISSGIDWAHADGLDLPEHNPAQAQRLLESAGWVRQGGGTRVARGVSGVRDGTPLRIAFLHFPTFTKYGELVRQHLGRVGIDVQLRALEPPVFATTVFEQDDFDTNVISYCNGPDPEVGVRRMYDSAQIGDVFFTNAAHYRNRQVDRLFAQASQTVDRDQRARQYRQIQEIVARDLPYLWLTETVGTRAWTADCRGFAPWTGLFAEAASCQR